MRPMQSAKRLLADRPRSRLKRDVRAQRPHRRGLVELGPGVGLEAGRVAGPIHVDAEAGQQQVESILHADRPGVAVSLVAWSGVVLWVVFGLFVVVFVV